MAGGGVRTSPGGEVPLLGVLGRLGELALPVGDVVVIGLGGRRRLVLLGGGLGQGALLQVAAAEVLESSWLRASSEPSDPWAW